MQKKKNFKANICVNNKHKQINWVKIPLVQLKELQNPKLFEEKMDGGECFRISADDLLKFTTL